MKSKESLKGRKRLANITQARRAIAGGCKRKKEKKIRLIAEMSGRERGGERPDGDVPEYE